MEDIGIFDFTIITIFGVSCIVGFIRGFVDETFSIFNLLLAAIVVYFSYDYVDAYLVDNGWETNLSKFLVGVCGVFVVAWIFFSSINTFLKSFFETFRNTIVDRSLGLVFGFLRGIIICVVVYLFIHVTHGNDVDDHPDFMKEASTYNFVRVTSGSILTRFTPGLYSESPDEGMSEGIKKAKDFFETLMLSDDEDEEDSDETETPEEDLKSNIIDEVTPSKNDIDKAFEDVMQEISN